MCCCIKVFVSLLNSQNTGENTENPEDEYHAYQCIIFLHVLFSSMYYFPISVLCVLFMCNCVMYCCIVCKCVMYCCHRVSTQLRLNIYIKYQYQ
jgi:hypothetical protein